MKIKIRKTITGTLCGATLLLAGIAGAQVRSPKIMTSPSYDLAAETVVQGTILKYTPNSTLAPLGAHVTVQTVSGSVDVHIGTDQFLKLHNFAITEGTSIRFIGQTRTVGTQNVFFARILSQGKQSLIVRSTTGMPLWPAGARAQRSSVNTTQKGSAL